MQKTIHLELNKLYHIYTRGNNKETIFKEAENYRHFLALFKKYISPVADTYAYCLLPNHFHFLIKIKEYSYNELNQPSFIPDPQRQFSHLLNAYTKAFNLRYDRTGSLFQERFRPKEVESEAYFTKLVFYIHFNPQRHCLTDDFRKWAHSSYHSILSENPTTLQRQEVLEWFGGREAYIEFHKENEEESQKINHLIVEDD